MRTEENEMAKPIIVIEERPEATTGQTEGEIPSIVVERNGHRHRGVRLRWIALTALIAILGCIAIWAGWRCYCRIVYIGVPVSTDAEQNIEKLRMVNDSIVKAEVVKTTDSILGVGMNIYEMRGLRAELWMHEPDTADMSVYMYCRSADHRKDMSIIGSMVIDGKEIATSRSDRKGYFAASGNNSVIGIARDEKVKEYVKETGGCYFRQFVLVSDHTLPQTFFLHGKVERRAIGRMDDDRLYFIETHGKETMWDFADALREYGFVDAIYITGGHDYCYYRDADGARHDIGDVANYPHKDAGQIAWLVFRY